VRENSRGKAARDGRLDIADVSGKTCGKASRRSEGKVSEGGVVDDGRREGHDEGMAMQMEAGL
jgi:hypothetical protein